MPKKSQQMSPDTAEILEVQGFDLLAQIEAMLRHARQYQREVQRLRGILGTGQTSTTTLPPLDAVRAHIDHLWKSCIEFADTLDAIMTAAKTPTTSRPKLVRPRRRT